MVRIACSFLLTSAVIMTFSIAFISENPTAANSQHLASGTDIVQVASLADN